MFDTSDLLRDMQERLEAARKRKNAERSRAYYAAHKEEIREKKPRQVRQERGAGERAATQVPTGTPGPRGRQPKGMVRAQ